MKRFVLVMSLYLFSTFFIVPQIAPLFGREKILESEYVKAHSVFYKLANRNYVRPQLNKSITKIAIEFGQDNSGIRLEYLDANFPFIDKFPLLPHLSHNDGKKVDICFIYQTKNGKLTNKKPSISGYGAYEEPLEREFNQTSVCLKQGSWQYDLPKHLTFGTINKDIEFSLKATKGLANIITQQKEIGKLFIEPHLKTRLNLRSEKVRFHGCQAVRHDDHIHFQLK